MLKKWCLAAAVDHKKITPHCLRRGGLNWAHKAELTGESLKVLGDWSSNAYNTYIDINFEQRVKSSQKMQQYIEEKSSLQCSRKKTGAEADINDNDPGVATGIQAVAPVHQIGGSKTVPMVVRQHGQRSYHSLPGCPKKTYQPRSGPINTGRNFQTDRL